MKNKIRINHANFQTLTDPYHFYVDSLAKAYKILEFYAKERLYQSDQYPVPGLVDFAVIEVWDEKTGEWVFVPE
jgi:hypothetical protein